MNALNMPAREATKLVAGFMHMLANCLEETAGVDKPATGTTTIHIDTATLHMAEPEETLAALRAHHGLTGGTSRRVVSQPVTADDVDAQTRDRIAARRKIERARRQPWWRAFLPDNGPGDQSDYALAGRKC